jgi:hypothetical protein
MKSSGMITLQVQNEPPNNELQSLRLPAHTRIDAVKQVLQEDRNGPSLILYLDSYFLEDDWRISELPLTPDSIIYVRTLLPNFHNVPLPRFGPQNEPRASVAVAQSRVREFENLEHSERNPEPPIPHGKNIESDINSLIEIFSIVDQETIRNVYIKKAQCNVVKARSLLAEQYLA